MVSSPPSKSVHLSYFKFSVDMQHTSPHVQEVSLTSHPCVVSIDAGLLDMANVIDSNEAHWHVVTAA
jgi:hypothetical protein